MNVMNHECIKIHEQIFEFLWINEYRWRASLKMTTWLFFQLCRKVQMNDLSEKQFPEMEKNVHKTKPNKHLHRD